MEINENAANKDYPKHVQSVRIYKRLSELCDETGLNLSYIIEACLINFFRLKDDEQVKLLVDNDPNVADLSELRSPMRIADEAKARAEEQLGPLAKRTSLKVLLVIGLGLLLTFLLSRNENK